MRISRLAVVATVYSSGTIVNYCEKLYVVNTTVRFMPTGSCRLIAFAFIPIYPLGFAFKISQARDKGEQQEQEEEEVRELLDIERLSGRKDSDDDGDEKEGDANQT